MKSLSVVLLVLLCLPTYLHAQDQSTTTNADEKVIINTMAFGSCLKKTDKAEILSLIAERKPDLYLWLGDNIYADTNKPEIMKRVYDQLRNNPNYQALRKASINMATWDDHDYGANDAGAEWKMKKEAQALFLEVFGEGKDDPRSAREGIYYARMFGPEDKRVQVIMLDTRYFRSDPKKGADKDATILGEAQWKWLEKELRKPVKIRFIASSIQVLNDQHKWEHWGHFPLERKRLFNLIKRVRARGVIFLSGDRHYSENCRLKGALGYTAWDLTSSGMDTGVPQKIALPSTMTVGKTFGPAGKFTEVKIDWDFGLVKVYIIDKKGQRASSTTIPFNDIGLPKKRLPGQN